MINCRWGRVQSSWRAAWWRPTCTCDRQSNERFKRSAKMERLVFRSMNGTRMASKTRKPTSCSSNCVVSSRLSTNTLITPYRRQMHAESTSYQLSATNHWTCIKAQFSGTESGMSTPIHGSQIEPLESLIQHQYREHPVGQTWYWTLQDTIQLL